MERTGVRSVKASYLSQHHTYQIKSFFPSEGHEHGDLKPLSFPSLTSTPEYAHGTDPPIYHTDPNCATPPLNIPICYTAISFNEKCFTETTCRVIINLWYIPCQLSSRKIPLPALLPFRLGCLTRHQLRVITHDLKTCIILYLYLSAGEECGDSRQNLPKSGSLQGREYTYSGFGSSRAKIEFCLRNLGFYRWSAG